jgi:amino acid adenylation domain-containing protein
LRQLSMKRSLSLSPESIADYVERCAAIQPDDGAIVRGDECWTYGAVDSTATRFARLLIDQGLRRGDRVCLLTSKTPAALVAMVGVLRAGGIYVPVDVKSPPRRVELIIKSAEPRVLLTTASAGKLVRDLTTRQVLPRATIIGSLETSPLDNEEGCAFSIVDTSAFSERPVQRTVRRGDPAHLLFTSGSTGIPKGVVITHANVIAFVEWAVRYFGIDASDRNSGHAPLHFDLSTFDIYGTLAAGAELHLVDESLNLLPHKLARFIEESQLTQWFSVPWALTHMAKFDAIPGDGLPSLKRVLWCGEVLPTPTLMYWMKRVPQASFTNLYGPTEATIASSYYTVPAPPRAETEQIPIGVACEGEELLVLDDDLHPVPPGGVGMLYIGGGGLSPGYWRDKDKTDAVFFPDPQDPTGRARIYRTGDLARTDEEGKHYFLGRGDSQIKSRGYRIELGEIEHALAACRGLSEYAVVGVPSELDGTSVCCAYAPAPGAEVSVNDLVADLSSLVPKYMLPRRWRAYPELPKNVNGKIDRPRLRAEFSNEA